MLNKELLMMGGAEELWTLQCVFTGDPSIKLKLQDSDGRLLWEGYPPTDTLTFRVPPDPTRLLFLYYSIGVYEYIRRDGCITDYYNMRKIGISVRQSKAYLEMGFGWL